LDSIQIGRRARWQVLISESPLPLSIGKLAPDAGEYYLEAVAQGVEDYYLGAGEAPGVWAWLRRASARPAR
jgi:hypothetical protein